MDEYGFEGSALTAINMFDALHRGTGRTTRLLERVQNGDQIVCVTHRERDRLTSVLRDMGKADVRVVAIDPVDLPQRMPGTTPAGRSFFEHEWVRKFMEQRIQRAGQDMESWLRAMSKTWPEAPEADQRVTQMMREWVK